MSDDRRLLGIDIGGTKVVLMLATASGELLAEVRLEDWTSGSSENDLERLAAESRELARNAECEWSEIACLGVSAAGPLDAERGVVLSPPNLPGWSDVPVGPILAASLELPVRLENDANAAALAEWRFGAGRGSRHLIYLTMSTGVGGGLVLDGRLYRGARTLAGEIGHMPIVPGGRRCGCGLRGCLEAYTSGAGVAARLREDAQRGEAADVLARAGGDARALSARHWIESVRARDAYALRLLDEYLDHLAQGLAVLVPVFDPERIVLGTIVRENPDLFLEPLRERVRARTWRHQHGVEIVAGELGPRLPAYAALSVALLEAP